MSDYDTLRLLLPILERASYHRGMSDRTGAAMLAALANLPRGWVFEDPEA